MITQHNNAASALDALDFFNSFSDEDLLDDNTPDPNAAIVPDILGDDGEILDPLLNDGGDEPDKPGAPDAGNPDGNQNEGNEGDENEEDEDEEKDDGEEDEEDDDEVNYFELFAPGLKRAGVIEVEDEEQVEWNEKTFLAKINSSIEKKSWQTLNNLATDAFGAAGAQIVQDLFVNKADIREYFQARTDEDILEKIDLTLASTQEDVVQAYLHRMGNDAAEIEDQLEFITQNNKLESYAKKYHEKLVQWAQEDKTKIVEQGKKAEKERLDRETDRKTAYQAVVDASVKTGEIKGYPITSAAAPELLSFVLDRPHVLPNGQRITDFEYKLAKMRQEEPDKFLAVARIVQADLDLTPVKKKAVTDETNEVFQELQVKKKTKGKKAGTQSSFFNHFNR